MTPTNSLDNEVISHHNIHPDHGSIMDLPDRAPRQCGNSSGLWHWSPEVSKNDRLFLPFSVAVGGLTA
jgi:hypothetical protein